MNLDDIASFLVTGKSGDEIFRAGEPGAGMYIVRQGQIELSTPDANGRTVTVIRLQAGQFFGEESLFENGPRSATARAVTDYQLIKVDAAAFARIVLENPSIAIEMMRVLVGRVAATPAQKTDRTPVLVERTTGKAFPIGADGELTVGRAAGSSGFKPEIDLSELDPERTLSRRHARIVNRGGTLYVRAVPEARNGTFVNGRRIEATEVKLNEGDRIAFGLIEVVLRYD